MKKLLFSPFLLVLLSTFLVQFGSVTSAVADDSHVGDIRYSILSEEQFRRLHGEEWELLQGQPVPADSELRGYWGDRNLPDARGVFLRGANHGRSAAEGNPEGNVGIGGYRADTFKRHRHEDSGHTHGLPIMSFMYGNGGNQYHTHTVFINQDHRGSRNIEHAKAQITETGDAETRPRNITVNTYIKMRESAPEVNQPEINAEWVARLFGSVDFLRSLTEAIRNAIGNLI